MTYATKQDLIDAYGEAELAKLTDRASATTIDDGVLGRALRTADAEIDSYLAKRAPTPISPVPPIVVEQACIIARFKLYKDHAPDRVRDAYKDAVAWLTKAAQGQVVIDGLPAPESAPSADTPLMESSPALFRRDAMRRL